MAWAVFNERFGIGFGIFLGIIGKSTTYKTPMEMAAFQMRPNQEYVSVHFSKNPRAKPPKTKVWPMSTNFYGKDIQTETEIDLGKDKITELSELRKAVDRVDIGEDIKKNMLRLIDKATKAT